MQRYTRGLELDGPQTELDREGPSPSPSIERDLEATIFAMAARVERLASQFPSQRLVSKRRAAVVLGVSRGRTLDRLIEEGIIRTVRIGNRDKVPMSEIERLVLEGAPNVPPPRSAASKRTAGPRSTKRPPNLAAELAKARAIKVSDL